MQNNSAPVELNSFYFTFNFKLNLKLFPELKIHFFLCHLDSLFLNIYKLIFFTFCLTYTVMGTWCGLSILCQYLTEIWGGVCSSPSRCKSCLSYASLRIKNESVTVFDTVRSSTQETVQLLKQRLLRYPVTKVRGNLNLFPKVQQIILSYASCLSFLSSSWLHRFGSACFSNSAVKEGVRSHWKRSPLQLAYCSQKRLHIYPLRDRLRTRWKLWQAQMQGT